MSLVRLVATVLFLAALGFACSSPTTQLVVTVDTDMCVPEAVDRIEIFAARGGDTRHVTHSLSSGAELPLTLSVVRSGSRVGDVEVVAVGWLGDAMVVERRAIAEYVPGEERILRLDLLQACAGRRCPTGQTCVDGACVSANVPEPALGPVTPDALAHDDAGICSTNADAGADGGVPDAPCACPSDGVDCTRDECDGAGVCRHLPDDGLCAEHPDGRCDPTHDCDYGCPNASDWCGEACGCDDHDPCTLGDYCDRSTGTPTCANLGIATGSCPDGDSDPCTEGVCTPEGRCEPRAVDCRSGACTGTCVPGVGCDSAAAVPDGIMCPPTGCATAAQCQAGACVNTTAGTCEPSMPDCQLGRCDLTTGACVFDPIRLGQECLPGPEWCGAPGYCDDVGHCIDFAALFCMPGHICVDERCVAGS